MNKSVFEFQNFEPDGEVALNAESMLLQLINLSPQALAVSAVIARTDHSYRCAINIDTKSTRFADECVCGEPNLAIDQIDQMIRRQILAWQAEHREDSASSSVSPFDKQEF